jgi:DNA-binding NarL/FixJ family response regulator
MKKILIVDDSKILRDAIKKIILAIEGLSLVGEAATPIRALEIYQKQNPDIIILDINLDIGNGLDILTTLHKSDNMPTVIMLTNYANSAFKTITNKLGAKYFFDKTKDIETLMDTLKMLASQDELTAYSN